MARPKKVVVKTVEANTDTKLDQTSVLFDQSEEIAILKRKGKQIEATNIDPETGEGALALLAMDAAESISVFKLAPISIAVKFVHCREAEQFNRDTGEIEGKLRSTFVTDTGETYTTNSPVVARVALGLLKSPAGKRPFDPPLTIHFKSAPTMSGGSCLTASVDLSTLRRMLALKSD